jgi:hypothetical protein
MNGEKGQALPIALVALAVGALVVVPFLSHAGTSLISSRVHGAVIAEQSASDAGVEHAIWSLTRGTLAKQFTQSGDQISYQLGETLNGFSTTVTVTANATSQNGTLGDIANSVIDTLEFDTSDCYLPSLIKVSNNVCAIAYRGTSNKGYLKTVSITASGDIGNSVIDTLSYESSACYEPDIIHVSGDVYAIAYRGNSTRGYLITMTITAGGDIGNSVIDTLTFDSSTCYEPAIIQVSGSTYAIAYRGQTNHGDLKTMSIAANGDIGAAVIDTLSFDASLCYTPSITQVSGSTFAVAYRGTSTRGYLKTMTIAANGDIGAAVIDTLTFDASLCYEPDIIPVSGIVFAVAYRGPSNLGYLKSMTIAANGDIGTAVIDTLTFDVSLCYEPDIVYVSGDVYAISYRGPTTRGYLKTMSIAANGDIAASVIDTLTFEASTCYEPVIVNVIGDIFAIAYRGVSSDGFIKTVGINTRAAVSASWEIVSTAGNTSIRAYVNTANTTSTIVSWQIE